MSTDNRIERAVKLNNQYEQQNKKRFADAVKALGLDVDKDDDIEIAQAVYEYQSANNLLTDGILGEKTQAKILEGGWKAPDGDEFFIVNGQKVKSNGGFKIVTMDEPGGKSIAKVTKKGYNNRSKKSVVDLFVAHWDGCYTAHDCFNVLVDRETGMHFGLDADGETVWQWLDLSLSAWGQNHTNDRAIGVEITNPVKVHKNGRFGGPVRPLVEIEVFSNGNVKEKVLGFTDKQIDLFVKLTNEMIRLFPNIKKQMPKYQPGRDKGPEPKDQVTRGMMPGAMIKNNVYAPGYFSGVCGHYHIKYSKNDPGAQLWQPLRDAGLGVA